MSTRLNVCLLTVFAGTGVSQAEKYQILESHNRLRQSVAQGQVANQPGAQNMQEMVWDDELAAKAQQWANQCTFEHDPSRYLGKWLTPSLELFFHIKVFGIQWFSPSLLFRVDRFTMGQNLAIIWSTIPLAENDGDFPSRIQNWFNEVRKYAWGAAWSAATGHYSQVSVGLWLSVSDATLMEFWFWLVNTTIPIESILTYIQSPRVITVGLGRHKSSWMWILLLSRLEKIQQAVRLQLWPWVSCWNCAHFRP